MENTFAGEIYSELLLVLVLVFLEVTDLFRGRLSVAELRRRRP